MILKMKKTFLRLKIGNIKIGDKQIFARKNYCCKKFF